MSDLERKENASPTPLPTPTGMGEIAREWLHTSLIDIEKYTKKDVLAVLGNMEDYIAMRIRLALERLQEEREETLLVILDTQGGSVETVKLIVETLRNFYKTVHFLVPVRAMSAGTVLVMSGDEIYMDYFSRLGPIDPQIRIGDSYGPALSYLRKYNEMVEKAKQGELTHTDVVLLQKLDLATLDQIELTKQLSVSLITEWLSLYKFKDWKKNGKQVDEATKRERAKKIADQLNDQNKWFVHGNGIHKDILEKDLELEIKDYGKDIELKSLVWKYFWAAFDYANNYCNNSFVHSRKFI